MSLFTMSLPHHHPLPLASKHSSATLYALRAHAAPRSSTPNVYPAFTLPPICLSTPAIDLPPPPPHRSSPPAVLLRHPPSSLPRKKRHPIPTSTISSTQREVNDEGRMKPERSPGEWEPGEERSSGTKAGYGTTCPASYSYPLDMPVWPYEWVLPAQVIRTRHRFGGWMDGRGGRRGGWWRGKTTTGASSIHRRVEDVVCKGRESFVQSRLAAPRTAPSLDNRTTIVAPQAFPHPSPPCSRLSTPGT
ncbi:hypothetical protein FA13DRAFT_1709861 [Coprinellus micaceus]|uniref:Uncharacterized protein n=1 Tax=Coprinellus micaceus TaxID=71717 RepID=A0A4Y7TA01_COPMI|nr:hypothetical protein FA13DRAFT_1709861 [Coprinellus micaceus]